MYQLTGRGCPLKETGISGEKITPAPGMYSRHKDDLTDSELDTLDLVIRQGMRRDEAAQIRNRTISAVDKQLGSARRKLNMDHETRIAFAAEVTRLGILPRIGPRVLGGRHNVRSAPLSRPAIVAGPRSMSGGPFTDYLESLGRCATQEDVAAVLYADAQEFGVDNFLLGAWAYQPDTGNPGPSFLTSYGEDWLKDLRDERYKADPILWHAAKMKDKGVFLWKDVDIQSTEERRFMLDADDAIGAKEGLSATLPGPLGMLGAVSFSAHQSFDADTVKEKLFARAAAAHLKIIDINFKSMGDFDLTETEMEILQELQVWSRSQIAKRRGVAVSTIKTHIDHIFEKLRVKREVNAIMRGFTAGLITPSDWNKF